VRTVLVTCTNGEFGDAPGHIKPGEEGHDPDDVARIRLGELKVATEALGVSHTELLGYRDSGMKDWPQNDDPRAFHHQPDGVVAALGFSSRSSARRWWSPTSPTPATTIPTISRPTT
jgi:LmbE family N-acetylglucosaminyl deacetylase